MNYPLVKGTTYYVVAKGGGEVYLSMANYNPYLNGPIKTGSINWISGTISADNNPWIDSTKDGGSISGLIVSGCATTTTS